MSMDGGGGALDMGRKAPEITEINEISGINEPVFTEPVQTEDVFQEPEFTESVAKPVDKVEVKNENK